MRTPTPDYGEPWSYGYGKVDREGYPSDNLRTWIQTHGETCDTFNGGDECNPFVMPGVHLARAMRAVACVNALAGVQDPDAHLANLNATIEQQAETLKVMNDALKEAHRIFGNLCHSPVVKALCPDFQEIAELVRKSHDQHA